jgi:hypothetical protein
MFDAFKIVRLFAGIIITGAAVTSLTWAFDLHFIAGLLTWAATMLCGFWTVGVLVGRDEAEDVDSILEAEAERGERTQS